MNWKCWKDSVLKNQNSLKWNEDTWMFWAWNLNVLCSACVTRSPLSKVCIRPCLFPNPERPVCTYDLRVMTPWKLTVKIHCRTVQHRWSGCFVLGQERWPKHPARVCYCTWRVKYKCKEKEIEWFVSELPAAKNSRTDATQEGVCIRHRPVHHLKPQFIQVGGYVCNNQWLLKKRKENDWMVDYIQSVQLCV